MKGRCVVGANKEYCQLKWVTFQFPLIEMTRGPLFGLLTPAAPGRLEVPAVPQTVQVQGWAQLPHHGRAHHQGTSPTQAGNS